MKKLIMAAMAMVLALALAGCGGNSGTSEVQSNEITDLLDKGLVMTASSLSEESFKAMIQTDGSYDEIYVVEAAMTPEKYAEYCELDSDAENYDELQRNFIGTLSDAKVTDVKDQIPDDDYFDSYEGKTIGDLEAEGYENTGNTFDDDGEVQFFYDGPKYCLKLEVKGKVKNLDDLSPNDIKKLKIDDIEFLGLSSMFID